MSERSGRTVWPTAKSSVLVAMSVWLVCALWVGSRMQVLPAVQGPAGAVPLDLLARSALVFLSLVLILLFGSTFGRFSAGVGGE